MLTDHPGRVGWSSLAVRNPGAGGRVVPHP
jgi:hypothetical protein